MKLDPFIVPVYRGWLNLTSGSNFAKGDDGLEHDNGKEN